MTQAAPAPKNTAGGANYELEEIQATADGGA
jgi:hypothetical protein